MVAKALTSHGYKPDKQTHDYSDHHSQRFDTINESSSRLESSMQKITASMLDKAVNQTFSQRFGQTELNMLKQLSEEEKL